MIVVRFIAARLRAAPNPGQRAATCKELVAAHVILAVLLTSLSRPSHYPSICTDAASNLLTFNMVMLLG
jgi:hypothetical protein